MRMANVLYVYDYRNRRLDIYTNLRMYNVVYREYTKDAERQWFAEDVNINKRFKIDYHPNKVFDNCCGVYTLWMDQPDKTKAYKIFYEYFNKKIKDEIKMCEIQLNALNEEFDKIVNNDLAIYLREAK